MDAITWMQTKNWKSPWTKTRLAIGETSPTRVYLKLFR